MWTSAATAGSSPYCSDESVMASFVNLDEVTGVRGGFGELLLGDKKYLVIFIFDKGNMLKYWTHSHTQPLNANLNSQNDLFTSTHQDSFIGSLNTRTNQFRNTYRLVLFLIELLLEDLLICLFAHMLIYCSVLTFPLSCLISSSTARLWFLRPSMSVRLVLTDSHCCWTACSTWSAGTRCSD